MLKNHIVRAWKDADLRASLTQSERAFLPAHPAGARLTELDEAELQNVDGGAIGCGLICTLTYDCADNWAEEYACDVYHRLRRQ